MESIPLWLYVLLEAAQHGNNGDRLGPVGGRIVAEVMMGLLDHYRDMSGKGLDYNPDKDIALDVNLVKTTDYGPRMSMKAFIDFAYAKPLADQNHVRGGESEVLDT